MKDYSRTVLCRIRGQLPSEKLEKEFNLLRRQAEKDFASEGWKGKIQFQRRVDVRYQGQGYELNILYSRKLASDFCEEHKRRYGYAYDNRDLELITLRLRTTIKSPQSKLSLGKVAGRLEKQNPPKIEKAQVYFNDRFVRTAIYSRDQLRIGQKYRGPAVLHEYSATTVVPQRMSFYLDKTRNLLIE